MNFRKRKIAELIVVEFFLIISQYNFKKYFTNFKKICKIFFDYKTKKNIPVGLFSRVHFENKFSPTPSPL